MSRVLLVHGAATGPEIWTTVVPLLADLDPVVLTRPRSGDLTVETDWLIDQAAHQAQDSWLVGISGGATLVLAAAAAGVHARGVLAHEPAAGSLVPGLLAPMVEAFEAGGTTAFARRLYGEEWNPPAEAAWLDDEVTRRELTMFRSFEPAVARPEAGRIVTSVGEESPPIRHQVANALADHLGVEQWALPHVSHLAPVQAPAIFASAIRALVSGTPR